MQPRSRAFRGSGARPGVNAGCANGHNHSWQPRSRDFARFGFSHFREQPCPETITPKLTFWHVKESAPLLVPKVEAIVHHYLLFSPRR